MKQYSILLFFTLLIVPTSLFGQSEDEIIKKLDKLFEKEQYDKCKNKANKIRSKQPKAVSPYYYLCKIEIHYFNQIENTPNKKQYKHLKSATNYSRKLKDHYPECKNELKEYFTNYINSWHDTSYTNTHVKKAVHTYTKAFRDTLPSYYIYYRKTNESAPKITLHKIPKTDSLRTELITFASNLVGIPYNYTGDKPETGFDCSGFVLYVYKHVGIELPHNAHLQSQLKGETLTLAKAKPGDLIFFGSRNDKGWRTQHAGIFYANDEGETKVIHCVSRGVTIDGNNSSWDSYWKDKVLFVKRLPEFK